MATADTLTMVEIEKKENKHKTFKCHQNVYTQDDEADLLQTDKATLEWYKGESTYDYVNGEPKDAKDKAKSMKATNLLWKSSTLVGFGIKGKFVLAYYCAPAAYKDTKKDYKMNVCKKDECKLCTESKDGKTKFGYNKCYNKLSLEKHNLYRIDHTSPKFAAYDEETAKMAQKQADKVDKDGKLTATESKKDDGTLFTNNKCKENQFKFDGTQNPESVWDVLNTDLAIKNWYENEAKYDYKTFKSKADTAPDNELVKKFTQVIWKYDGDKIADIKVGFGISASYVIAYYCKGGNIDGKYDKNVLENCLKDKYNKCYNDKAVKRHNEKRKAHFTDGEKYELTVDIKAAVEI